VQRLRLHVCVRVRVHRRARRAIRQQMCVHARVALSMRVRVAVRRVCTLVWASLMLLLTSMLVVLMPVLCTCSRVATAARELRLSQNQGGQRRGAGERGLRLRLLRLLLLLLLLLLPSSVIRRVLTATCFPSPLPGYSQRVVQPLPTHSPR